MTPESALGLAREALWVAIAVGAPALLAALTVGVLISLVQALTQIQENTLSFLPKLLAILAIQLLTLPFAFTMLGDFTRSLFGRIAGLGASLRLAAGTDRCSLTSSPARSAAFCSSSRASVLPS